MLFSRESYYQDSNSDLLKFIEKSYNEAITLNQTYWSEGDIDARVEAGDQSAIAQLYSALPVNQRKSFNFNRIRRTIEMVSGHQQADRKSTIYVPIENGDQQTADQFTKIFLWLNQQEGILETISESFHDALVTGMNLVQVWVDYRNDPINGSIKVNNCAYNSFLVDPYFRKHDLSDCNYLWKRTYLTPAECISLLPDKEKEIADLNPGLAQDGKFQSLPENFKLDTQKLLAYDEFYYRTYRKQKILVDSQTGETLEWQSNNNDTLKKFIAMYPQVEVIDTVIPSVNLAIIVQGKVLYNGKNPLGLDVYPFVPVFAYFNPDISEYALRIQGMVRGLRDAQFLYNRRKVIELDTLESQVNSGWIYKENALVNPEDVFQSGQGKGIALKKHAQMTDVQQITPAPIAQSTIELSKSLADEIQQISGVSEELLGSATDDKAGILSMLRQGSALKTIQGFFTKLDYSQKLLGGIILKVIQNNFTPGKVQRIIEEEPTKEFYNKYFGKYDAAVEAGVNTTTQRQLALSQMLHLREAGIPIPDKVIIENLTVQNKQEIIDAIEQEKQQAQQQEQQAQQVQLQELQSRANLSDARAEADRGLAVERTSRVAENESMAIERQAEAAKDRMAGVLDMVKALKEIETIDLNQLQTLVTLTQMLKSEELQAKVAAKSETLKDVGATKSPASPQSPEQEVPVSR